MDTRINLLTKEPAPSPVIARRNSLLPGGVVLFGLTLLVAIGVHIYAAILTNESQVLAQTISDLETKITSYKDIEEKKSVLTIKTDELQKIYENRFDYVKALDDIQKLFAYSLTIQTITIESSGTAQVSATKTGEIVISQPEALGTNIQELTLTLVVPTSEELQETVDNLKTYLGAGLTGVDVTGSKKVDTGGYEVQLRLTFGPSKPA